MPITSRRDKAIGIVLSWIGLGVAHFSSAIAREIASLRPKPSKKVNELAFCVRANAAAARNAQRLVAGTTTPRAI
jgi:hypothetical protein